MTTQPPEALPALIERLRLLDRITELEAQLDAIGAGGVSPLIPAQPVKTQERL